jgi:hypothetical protein
VEHLHTKVYAVDQRWANEKMSLGGFGPNENYLPPGIHPPSTSQNEYAAAPQTPEQVNAPNYDHY